MAYQVMHTYLYAQLSIYLLIVAFDKPTIILCHWLNLKFTKLFFTFVPLSYVQIEDMQPLITYDLIQVAPS